jgi:hypothetical protein
VCSVTHGLQAVIHASMSVCACMVTHDLQPDAVSGQLDCRADSIQVRTVRMSRELRRKCLCMWQQSSAWSGPDRSKY